MIAFVTSFAGASVAQRSFFLNATTTASKPSVSPPSVRMDAGASPSVPFLPRPAKLDGSMAGDVGFDPLGFSDKYDLNFLREAELKHCRICMLAILGWIFPEAVYHLPNEIYSATNPLAAPGKVGWLPVIQILLFIAACEAPSVAKVYEDNCANPGNYGFDPFGMSKSADRKKFYEVAELKNGRLAMVAIGGAIHHALLTNVGMVEQIEKGLWFGGYYVH